MIQLLLYSMLPKGTQTKGFTGDVCTYWCNKEYSNNDTDWKYVIAGWTTNVQKAKMTPLEMIYTKLQLSRIQNIFMEFLQAKRY